MKHLVKLLALLCLPVATAIAEPLPKAEIDANAKWVVHLDMQQFRSSKLGGYVVNEILKPKVKRPLSELEQKFKFEVDPDKFMEKLGSITIYGTDYTSPKDNAVLMIRANPDLEAAFVGVLAGLSLAGTNSPVVLTQKQIGKVTLYSEQDKVHCAILPGKVVVLSASLEATEKAAKVLDGKAASLASKGKFTEYGKEEKPCFFMSLAEGFNGDMALPPQAKLLQMADGGQIVLGENEGQLFLSLALKAKTQEIVTQMQQVIQGLIAVSSMNQSQNNDITQLVQAIKVSAADKVVSVRVEYPASKVIQRIEERMDKKRQAGNFKAKADADAPAQPQTKSE